ncbi:MAG: DUF2905 domain-containing protein [Candidatus Omnitrophica bacterium]|nr:DUF2905 domain-containing protein [Candidatus Omnitrophota bacterium]
MSPDLQPFGRAVLMLGLCLVGIGVLLLVGPRIPWLGRLPGDIAIRRDGFSFYFPLTSCLLLSALLSVVLWLINRFRHS